MLRFASSPTGDMHIGGLRVALFNHLVAQEKKEDLIIRIEDMDKEKNIEGKDKEILDILGLFGINYSQVIYQSESIRFHSAMALQLVHEKKAFSCFCSDLWLEKKRDESKLAKKTYLYDDACQNLPAELVIDNMSPFSIRITKPGKSSVVDSFIILHQDKTPTYTFSGAVDDMLNDISIVIRDAEFSNITSMQEHIRESLAYDKKIGYVHIASIVSDDIPSIKYLLEEGFLPEAISNYLISIGNETPTEIFTVKEAMEWFTLDTLSSSPTPFDMKKLRHINKEHLKALDSKELSRYVGFADTEIGELARIYLEEDAATTKELKAKIAPIFNERIIPDVLSQSVIKMKSIIMSAPYFDKYDDFKNYIIKESGLKEDDYSKALRILLTNAQNGPDLAEIYKYLKNYIGEIVK
ncbi:glutamate--tRNA ligase [Sulfurimonas sp. SAG-AH-194-C21]|nr:glutamate--tRNA ligase family protein [Sulfurimonas sp. SAG-AH-194-C21]MDF1883777.1 glutamate--tRNA ligase [Sulfurimonas sp. SAG-AH-194-C21]